MHDVNTIKIDKNNDDEFNYEYLENIIKNNEIVFIYMYTEALEKALEGIMDKNIEEIQSIYNPNITLMIEVNNKIHQKLITIFNKEIVYPTILVVENQEVVEFLQDAILIKR